MAGIGLSDAVASTAASGAAAEYKEFTEERKQYFIRRVKTLQTQLNRQYALNIGQRNILNNKERHEMQKTSVLEKLAQIHIEQYPSSKGGANIIPNKNGKSFTDMLKEYPKEWQKQVINDSRKEVYALQESNEMLKLARQTMQMVYELQAELTGITTEIAITFSEAGYFKVIHIPMKDFLSKYAILSLDTVSAASAPAADPYAVRLHLEDSVLEKMQKNYPNNVHNVALQDYVDAIILRTDKNYEVGKKGEVAEAILRSALFGTDPLSTKDKSVWFKRGDVQGILGETGERFSWSVKNATGGDPTLVKINTIHAVLSQLSQQLTVNKSNEQIANNIRTQVFSKTSDIDGACERLFEELLSIIH